MPEFEQYPNESKDAFAQRMKKQSGGGGMVRAANRFDQSKEQERPDKNKPVKE